MRLVRALLLTTTLAALAAGPWLPVAHAVTVPAPLAAYGTIGTRGHGASVAIDGEWMAVGAPNDDDAGDRSGAVHLYKRGLVDWTYHDKIPSWAGDTAGRFGMTVAMDGEWLAVGAPQEPHSDGKGWVYLYERSGDQWQKAQFLKGPDWGHAIAFDGDRLLIGQPNDATYAPSGGSVQVHRLVGGTWYWEQALFPADPTSYQFFGLAIDADDGRAAIGAPYRNQVYVFARDGATWTQEAKVQVPEAQLGAMYGNAVAIDGDTLAMGGIGDVHVDPLGGRHYGGVQVFVRSTTGWNLQQALSTLEGDRSFGFGHRVAVSGDTIVVGAPLETVDGKSEAGAAYVFQRAGAVWGQQATLEPDEATKGGRFGSSLAFTAEALLVGTPGDTRLGPNAGVMLAFPRVA